ncbi:hypothetical protein DTW90_15750 [Neorhizobium sp. P12A]|jgi:hypothetical protein|uniref:hypothetical protein n=1 Tax=Neorhizobium sp. P12A TaxID=2268027 RepID=UPI0011EBBAC1|nr:hypothetical protein [Neorhizobium sp. P12A]KAA0698310.1 hypothetical protein DTW90_15750 [Neorhizobium sp. P12A]
MIEILSRDELETRIAEVSENIRTLIEQAAAVSGPADEERINDRIEEQQALYEELVKQRDALDQSK